MGAVSKIFPVVPVDPITTTLSSKLPKPLRTIVNPAGPALKAALGDQGARAVLDPLGMGKDQANQDHMTRLLGDDPKKKKRKDSMYTGV